MIAALQDHIQDQWYFLGSVVVVLCGAVFCRSYSTDVFRQTVAASGVPTPAQYLVGRLPFMIGKWAFVGFCLLAYAFALVFYRQLPALVDLMPGAKAVVGDNIKLIEDKTHPSILVITIVVTAAFLTAVKKDFPGNVIYRFRSLIYSMISVTFAYDRIRERLLNSMTVPADKRPALLADPKLGIVPTDFELSQGDPDRQWADLCYMHGWAEKGRAAGNDIFTDGNFDPERSHNQFIALRELVRGCKAGDADASAARPSVLKDVRGQYARYMACLLLTSSTSRQSLHDSCHEAAIDIGPLTVENPLLYSAIYLIALAVTIIAGPYLCAVGFDFCVGDDLQTAFLKQDVSHLQRWLVRGLATYFTPICFILVVRNVLWRVSPQRTHPSLVTYGWILLLAFGISLLGSTLVSLLVYPTTAVDWDRVVDVLWGNALWSISPALTSIYINYYLDRQADPAKEDIVQTRQTFVARLLSALGFTAAIMVFTILVLAYQHVPSKVPSNTGSVEKLHTVVVGTVTLITITLCLVAQFGLRKRHDDSRTDKDPAPLDRSATVGAGIELTII